MIFIYLKFANDYYRMILQLVHFLQIKKGKINLVFLTFIGLYLISNVLITDSYKYLNLPFSAILCDILNSLILSILIVELCFYIDRKLNRFIPWSSSTTKRLIVQTAINIFLHILLFIIYFMISYFVMQIFEINYTDTLSTDSISDKNLLYYYILNFTFLTLLISLINTVYLLSSNWKKEILTATEYRIRDAENKNLIAQSELQALRLQLDPHFVFNNLSVLSELILKDQQLGFEYTENFSVVYRYLLINAKKQLISLYDEIKFLQSYLFLLENRMGSGLAFEINIEKEKLKLNLPPVTLQLLVENAIKHNSVDKENPLLIKIYTNNVNELVIENTLLPLFKSPISAGVGLENITRRYALLSNLKPKIVKNNAAFVVKIPLLK